SSRPHQRLPLECPQRSWRTVAHHHQLHARDGHVQPQLYSECRVDHRPGMSHHQCCAVSVCRGSPHQLTFSPYTVTLLQARRSPSATGHRRAWSTLKVARDASSRATFFSATVPLVLRTLDEC